MSNIDNDSVDNMCIHDQTRICDDTLYFYKNMKFEHFDTTKIKDNACIIIVGPRRTGKLQVCANIVRHKYSDCTGYFLNSTYNRRSATNGINFNFNSGTIIEKNISSVFSIDLDLCDYIVFEDNQMNTDLIENIVTMVCKPRIIIMQYLPKFNEEVFKKIDYFFVYDSAYLNYKQHLYNYHLSIFDNFEQFSSILSLLAPSATSQQILFNSTVDNFNVMVVDNTVECDQDLTKSVFWYNSRNCNRCKILYTPLVQMLLKLL